jgi:hypothetical protein
MSRSRRPISRRPEAFSPIPLAAKTRVTNVTVDFASAPLNSWPSGQLAEPTVMTRRSLRLYCKLGVSLAVASAISTAGAPAWAGLSGPSKDEVPTQMAAVAAPRATSVPTPQQRAVSPAPATPAAATTATPNYDGRWLVHSSPGCLLSATSIATVSHGRISGPGYSGTISPDGTVHSSGRALLLVTFVSSGHSTETQGSGTFRESDGCTGTWSSHKL